MMRYAFLLAVVLGLANSASSQTDDALHTRGWVEHARLMPFGILMDAKLDSGARTTSIHAEILPAERASDAISDTAMASLMNESEGAMRLMTARMSEDEVPDDPPPSEITPMAEDSMDHVLPDTVTFRLTNRTGKEIILTESVTRWVSIRRRGGGSIIRPVVMMDLCIGARRVTGEVNLADRTGFNYPLLIGRNMLSSAAISVDSSQIYTAETACPDAS